MRGKKLRKNSDGMQNGPVDERLWIDPNNMRFSGRNREKLAQSVREAREEFHGPWIEVQSYHPPVLDSSDDEVEKVYYHYEDSPPQSFIVSGPLGPIEGGGAGPGRRFHDIDEAEQWVVDRYGGYIRRVVEAEFGGRWAFRVLPRTKFGGGVGDGKSGDVSTGNPGAAKSEPAVTPTLLKPHPRTN